MSETLYLAHHGVKGQKWGVRRYQNEDGSLTPAGKNRYLKSDGTLTRAGRRRQALRNDYITRNEHRLERYEYEQAQAKRTFDDLKKNGVHGSAFKDEYGDYSDADFEARYGASKKEHLRATIDQAREELKKANLNKEKMAVIRSDIEKVKNTPIDQVSYVEDSDKHAKLLAAGYLGSSVLTFAAAGLLDGTGHSGAASAVLIGGSILGAIGFGAAANADSKSLAKKHGMSGET